MPLMCIVGLQAECTVTACAADDADPGKCNVCQSLTHLTVGLQLTKEDFPLPTLRPKLLDIGKEVNSGRGFKLVRCCTVLCCAVLRC